MKNLVLGITYTILGCITIAIIMTLYGRMERSDELERNLSSIVEETVENMMLHTDYEITDKDQFISDLVQNLSVAMETDSDIKVSIMKEDTEKGLLSVRVYENFKHPNDKDGTVSCDRTVIFNSLTEEENITCDISFYLSKEDMLNNRDCYKKYKIRLEDSINVPKNPQLDGKTFKEWRNEDGTVADFPVSASGDAKYYAVWN